MIYQIWWYIYIYCIKSIHNERERTGVCICGRWLAPKALHNPGPRRYCGQSDGEGWVSGDSNRWVMGCAVEQVGRWPDTLLSERGSCKKSPTAGWGAKHRCCGQVASQDSNYQRRHGQCWRYSCSAQRNGTGELADDLQIARINLLYSHVYYLGYNVRMYACMFFFCSAVGDVNE